MRVYRDRFEAGRELGEVLKPLRERRDVVVLALPRGGVATGVEVAAALSAPLGVLVVRKVGHPRQPELALGAVASGGVRVLQPSLLRKLGLTAHQLEPIIQNELREVTRREQAYGLSLPAVEGKVVVLVDDGLATGSTMEAALRVVRQLRPAALIVAVPVGPEDTCRRLAELAQVVCLQQPRDFGAVGYYYEDFGQLSDADVIALLSRTSARR